VIWPLQNATNRGLSVTGKWFSADPFDTGDHNHAENESRNTHTSE
jgi:hypothetical protein